MTQPVEPRYVAPEVHALPEAVGLLGGGRMGAGIAQVALGAGSAVVLVEASREAAHAAQERVRAGLAKAAERGSLPEGVAAAEERLAVGTDPQALAPCGLVVEAVPEDQELKRTAVYELQIDSWSGKENWKDQADQSDEWPPLDARWQA